MGDVKTLKAVLLFVVLTVGWQWQERVTGDSTRAVCISVRDRLCQMKGERTISATMPSGKSRARASPLICGLLQSDGTQMQAGASAGWPFFPVSL